MSMSVQLDQAKAAAFEGRLVEMLNAGALSLMVSVGHRTGLFDAMAGLPPATSVEIARRGEAAGALRAGMARRDGGGRRRRL